MSGDLINSLDAWFRKGVGAARVQLLRVLADIDPEALSTLFSTNHKATIVQVATKDTKQTHTLQDGLKQLIIRAEKVTQINYEFDTTKFDAGEKLTITSGGHLKLSAINFSSKALYFETDRDNINVEIIELY